MEAFLLLCGESFNFKKENIFFYFSYICGGTARAGLIFVLWVYLVGK